MRCRFQNNLISCLNVKNCACCIVNKIKLYILVHGSNSKSISCKLSWEEFRKFAEHAQNYSQINPFIGFPYWISILDPIYWTSILNLHIGFPYWIHHIGFPYWISILDSILDFYIGFPYQTFILNFQIGFPYWISILNPTYWIYFMGFSY